MKRDLDPKFAKKVAADFLKKTKDIYARVELAGSLRRNQPVVHDVDFAVIPKGDDFAKWKEEVTARVEKIGGKVISFGEVIADFLYRGVQVNLFLCPGPRSWGVTLMWARDKGLLINSRGIWTRDEPPNLVPARTEHDIARILEWKYKPPETRGKDTKEKASPY